MSTIFVTCFHGLIGRNILDTKVLGLLAERGVRVVLIVPDYKRDYFAGRFGRANVLIEGVEPNRASRYATGLLFKRLSQMMLPTRSMRILQGYRLWLGKGMGYTLFFRLAQLLGRSPLAVRFVRYLDVHLSPAGLFEELIRRHRPDLVFATDVMNENDVAVMQDARRSGIPILAMARSWDNFTVLGLMRFLPDRLLVWNEILKKEAVGLHRMPSERINAIGVPHYDRYLRGPSMPRRDFLRKIGADPARPLIFFAPIGELYLVENDSDRYVLEILSGLNFNVLVRFPPFDTVACLDGVWPSPGAFFDRPGLTFQDGIIGHREISRQDDDMLLNGIAHSQVVVTGPSTIIIEAALLDKPIILADVHRRPRSFFEGVYSYGYDHIAQILASNGTRRAGSADELLRSIHASLADPDAGQEGRARIARGQCGPADGRASQRLATAILAALEEL